MVSFLWLQSPSHHLLCIYGVAHRSWSPQVFGSLRDQTRKRREFHTGAIQTIRARQLDNARGSVVDLFKKWHNFSTTMRRNRNSVEKFDGSMIIAKVCSPTSSSPKRCSYDKLS